MAEYQGRAVGHAGLEASYGIRIASAMKSLAEHVYMIGFHPDGFSAHSGMHPIVQILGAKWVEYTSPASRVMKKSWTLGNALKQWGIRKYGSTWNSWLPFVSEWQIRCQLPNHRPHIAHFLWGEFGSPSRVKPYHRRAGNVVVTVHCSARRWDQVWLRPDGYAHADHVIITSESQRPFVSRHVSPQRITRILHGIDSDYFHPLSVRKPNERFRLLLLGNTERDHEWASRIARDLPSDRFEYRIRTLSPDRVYYEGISSVNMLPCLSNEELLQEYQQADLLVMPMLDSAANNVLLESMACGTPVMVNRVGGVSEYVDESGNILMENDRKAEAWVDRLIGLEKNRMELAPMRTRVRSWAETLDNRKIAPQYEALYANLLGSSGE